jgi:polyvinyl alcohol dehydrogenase (cytochrome)
VPAAETEDGRALYTQHCAECHDNPTGRIPPRSFIADIKPPESIIKTLTNGAMRQMAKTLDQSQIHDIAVFLARREPGSDPQPDLHANMCKDDGGPIDLDQPSWNGWGRDVENTRFQPNPGLAAEDLPRLKVKWVFAYPDIAYGQPVIVSGRIFVESREGEVFSLDARTGCTHWVFETGAPVRTAVSIGPLPKGAHARFAAYFGDEKGVAYAVDAMTGQKLWATKLEDHPLARITGAPKLYDGRLYVPMSSMEEVGGATPRYACCTFRGSITALDGATGKIVWRTYTISKPVKTKLNGANVQMFGPAGVAVWDSPTIDAKRKLLYVGTGDSYTDVPVDSDDSILALDLKTGQRRWVSQVRKSDAWLLGCPDEKNGNCPTDLGPDHDFGSSPILHTLPDGKQIILAGAKSSIEYGFDPDHQGKIVWQQKLNQGSATGGIEWGPAADGQKVYVAIADAIATPPYKPGGVAALDPATGTVLWRTPAPPPVCDWGPAKCSAAQASAVSVIPGAVFAGSWDGHLRAYDPKDGAILWDFDTAAQSWDGVNGVKAEGGGIDQGGQAIADGMVVVNSGVTALQHPGNALIVLTVDGK